MPKRNFLQKAINYLKTGIWLQSDHIESKWLRWLINEAKVIIIAVNNYSRHQIAVRSAALTFYTLMSLVPIVAMIFGIAKGFGIDNKVISYIGQELNAYKELFDQISIFANAFLENSKVGIFAGVSVFVFIWAVIMVFGNIESAFNYIWEIKKQRTISRKVSDYLSVLFVIPLLYVLYKSVSSHIEGTLFVWAADLTFMTNIHSFDYHLAHIRLDIYDFTEYACKKRGCIESRHNNRNYLYHFPISLYFVPANRFQLQYHIR